MPKTIVATVPHEKPALTSDRNLTADDLARRFAAFDDVAEEVEAPAKAEAKTEAKADDATEVVEEVEAQDEIESETPVVEEEAAEEVVEETTEEVVEDGDVKLEYPKFKARVDKLTAQKKELEAKLAEAEAKAATPPATEVVAVAPTSANPFSNLVTLDSVTKELQQAESVLRWVSENSDGVVVKGKDGVETEYTSEEVAKIRYNAEKAIRSDLPKQWEYVQQAQHFAVIAETEYPWLKDKSSANYVEAQAALQAFPELLRFAEHRVVVGDLIAGRRLREAKAAKAKTAVVAAKVAPKIVAKPVAAPRKVAAPEVAKVAAKKYLSQTGGSRQALENYFNQ